MLRIALSWADHALPTATALMLRAFQQHILYPMPVHSAGLICLHHEFYIVGIMAAGFLQQGSAWMSWMLQAALAMTSAEGKMSQYTKYAWAGNLQPYAGCCCSTSRGLQICDSMCCGTWNQPALAGSMQEEQQRITGIGGSLSAGSDSRLQLQLQACTLHGFSWQLVSRRVWGPGWVAVLTELCKWQGVLGQFESWCYSSVV